MRTGVLLLLIAVSSLVAGCGLGGTTPASTACSETTDARSCPTLTHPYTMTDALAFYDLGSIPVFPQPGLGDYQATIDPVLGPVILFDPSLQVGPEVHTFFIAHEVGHHALAHLFNHPPNLSDAATARCLEFEADCYATRVLSQRARSAVSAAKSLFESMGPASADAKHPQFCARAAYIEQCLAEALGAGPDDVLSP